MIDKSAIRNAATLILVRDVEATPSILMGQRGEKAAFMPNKFVFPGGAVDRGDSIVPLATPMSEPCRTRLGEEALAPLDFDTLPHALATAAIRELWEEAGLIMGHRGDWEIDPPEDWADFAATGHVPAADMLHFVFRAITPPGRPRRFDARFLLADAAHLAGDLDDFSRASDELSHLQWIPIEEARSFNLPFITEVVLAEVAKLLPVIGAPETVPFFHDKDEERVFARLGAEAQSKYQD
ncbi:MAG: 8-oxo-dGTP pyrophosphatase MutT (NUDIX family) [Halocynthiibacter sp.]|jgi:8-oxo-dGTP pyrophosphatase MutT (NUDIX family)